MPDLVKVNHHSENIALPFTHTRIFSNIFSRGGRFGGLLSCICGYSGVYYSMSARKPRGLEMFDFEVKN
jgi:hypothetical protein